MQTPCLSASRRFPAFLVAALSLGAVSPAPTAAPEVHTRVPVEELRLENGMKLLLVQQPESTTVSAGWVVGVGSAEDPPNGTGLSHLLEHLMFQGTRSVGTRDIEQEEALLGQIDQLWERRRALASELQSAAGTKRRKLARQHDQLSQELESLQQQARSLARLGEFSLLYSEQGATGLDANTHQDMTLYFVTLPAEKLELWFWLESDRLAQPVFREIHKEIGVIYEERRLRVGATATGALDENLRALFWGEHPYAWNPMGRNHDLDSLGRADARAFFERHYRPENLTAALVGAFERDRVLAWAQLYFGRLPRVTHSSAETAPPQWVLPEQETLVEETCRCPPQVQILYPAAAFANPDHFALQLVSAILNGRAGRLYRDLVVDRQLAFSAYTEQVPRRLAGKFAFRAESKGSVDPATLVTAWDGQVELLRTEPPSIQELDRARTRLTADAFRSLKEPTGLMQQLLVYEGLGDWRYIHDWAGRILQVTPQDILDVAVEYLRPERRTVAIYRQSRAAKAASGPAADGLADRGDP